MKNIKSFAKFNEKLDFLHHQYHDFENQFIPQRLKQIFKPLSKKFDVDVQYTELANDVECYVDIDGDDNWDNVYTYIDEAIDYIKSIGGKMKHIILSDDEDEFVKKSIAAALTLHHPKNDSNKKDITSIRIWFDLKFPS